MSTLRVCPTMAATPDSVIAVAAAAASATTTAEVPRILIDLLVICFLGCLELNCLRVISSSNSPGREPPECDRHLGHPRCHGIVNPEETDLLVHALRLLFQRLGGGRVLLDQRRILLRDMVHLRQSARDLVDAARLLGIGGCDRGDEV